MASPTFFGDGHTPAVHDTEWRINQKILGALIDGGGGAGTSTKENLALGGAVPPVDGSVTAFEVYDTDTGNFWYNKGTLASPSWVAE